MSAPLQIQFPLVFHNDDIRSLFVAHEGTNGSVVQIPVTVIKVRSCAY